MGAQWEDDSDKCGCEWPGPGSLVSPSLVPCDNQLCGAAWCSVPATLLILHHSLYLSPVKHQHYTPKGQDAVGKYVKTISDKIANIHTYSDLKGVVIVINGVKLCNQNQLNKD